jgi:hypothetical protein
VNVHSDNPRPPRWLSKTSIVVGLALVVLLVVSAFVIHAPSVRPDELGFLLNGQVFTGNNETPLAEGFRSFYPAGFGFFTAVAAILGGTIAAQFRIALLFNIAFTIGTAWVLMNLTLRHFTLNRKWAAIVAIAVSVTPTVAANSLFAWSESLSRLGLAGLVLLVYETARQPTWKLTVGTGLLAAYLPIVHGRFTLVLPLVVITLLVLGISRNHARVLACGSGIVVAAVSYLVMSRANVWLRLKAWESSTMGGTRRRSSLLEPRALQSIALMHLGCKFVRVVLRPTGVRNGDRRAASTGDRPRLPEWFARRTACGARKARRTAVTMVRHKRIGPPKMHHSVSPQ